MHQDLTRLSGSDLARRYEIKIAALNQWISGRCKPRYTTLSHLSEEDRRSLIAEIDRRRKVRRELKEGLSDE